MAQNQKEKAKSENLNPLIALWEKIPAAVRLPVFAVIVIAALVYVKMGGDVVPPEGGSSTAAMEEPSRQPEVAKPDSFTGVFVEWPEGEIEAYVTNYIQDDQVLVSMTNISPDKKFFIDKIHLVFKDQGGKALDAGAISLEKELGPGEGTGLFDFKTDNQEKLTKDELNKNVRTVEVVLEIKDKRATTSTM